MRTFGVVAVVLVAACGEAAPSSTTGFTTSTSAPTHSISAPAASTSAPAASPTRQASSSQPGVNFSCRLPVVWSPYEPGATAPGDQWGFVQFPNGALSVQTTPLPNAIQYQISWPGVSYDHAVNRWLPVSRAAVTSDGLRYAYADYDPAGPADGKAIHANSGRVHLVDVRSGGDTVLYSGSPSFGVVDVEADAIYLTVVGTGFQPTARGLYRLSPAGGVPQLLPGTDSLTDPSSWTFVGEKFAWAVDFPPGVVPGMGSGGNQLIRYDLTTGMTEPMLVATAGAFIAIAGLDPAGRPIVVSGPASTQDPETTEYVTALIGQPGQLARGSEFPVAPWASDVQGVWMSGEHAVWLHGTNGTLLRFPVLTGGQTTSPVGIGGACL